MISKYAYVIYPHLVKMQYNYNYLPIHLLHTHIYVYIYSQHFGLASNTQNYLYNLNNYHINIFSVFFFYKYIMCMCSASHIYFRYNNFAFPFILGRAAKMSIIRTIVKSKTAPPNCCIHWTPLGSPTPRQSVARKRPKNATT